jgi:4-hydroxy-2-oxoheptanedioate aldolase
MQDNIRYRKIRKEFSIGTWLTIPSAMLADVISSSGIDFVVIDLEHGPIDYSVLANMVLAIQCREVAALVRVGGLNSEQISVVLDLGIDGIHVPNITSKKDAIKVVELVNYPPGGKKGFSPFTRRWDYAQSEDVENIFTAIHIEGKSAIEQLDEILNVKGIDLIFIGLYDLSMALGVPGRIEDAMVLEEMKKIVQIAKKKNIRVGSIVSNINQIKKLRNMGVRYITYSADCEVIASRYKSIVMGINKENDE